MLDWSNAVILKFLELLAKEKLIWDPREKNHKIKHKTHEGWKRISSAMGISIEKLKVKKKSLMATFRPLFKKKKASITSGSGPDDIFQPIWFAYDMMESFLGTVYDADETIEEDKEPQPEESLVSVSSPSPLSQHDETPPPSSSRTNSQNTDHKTTTKIPLIKKSLSSGNVDDAQRKINDTFDTLNRVLKKRCVEDDDCGIYAKLLAKKLRKYPEGMRYRIMYNIDGLLLDNPPDGRPPSAGSSYSIHSPQPSYTPPHVYLQMMENDDEEEEGKNSNGIPNSPQILEETIKDDEQLKSQEA